MPIRRPAAPAEIISSVCCNSLVFLSKIAPKLKPIGTGRGGVVVVCEAVASGDAELGIQQIAEILAVPDVELAGALPSELQKTADFFGRGWIGRKRFGSGPPLHPIHHIRSIINCGDEERNGALI